jgi:hypothetical protein
VVLGAQNIYRAFCMRSRGWVIGWVLGTVVIVIAAGLLLELILRARRITSQARDIEEALEAAREHTDALFDLAKTNTQLERIAPVLRADRGGAAR